MGAVGPGLRVERALRQVAKPTTPPYCKPMRRMTRSVVPAPTPSKLDPACGPSRKPCPPVAPLPHQVGLHDVRGEEPCVRYVPLLEQQQARSILGMSAGGPAAGGQQGGAGGAVGCPLAEVLPLGCLLAPVGRYKGAITRALEEQMLAEVGRRKRGRDVGVAGWYLGIQSSAGRSCRGMRHWNIGVGGVNVLEGRRGGG